MQPSFELVACIVSTALFDCRESHEIWTRAGIEPYKKHQHEHVDVPLRGGKFTLIFIKDNDLLFCLECRSDDIVCLPSCLRKKKTEVFFYYLLFKIIEKSTRIMIMKTVQEKNAESKKKSRRLHGVYLIFLF